MNLITDFDELNNLITDLVKNIPDDSKIACFDMDGTLVSGDTGEAVFAQLLNDAVMTKLTWAEYQKMLAEGKTLQAYRKMVEAMDGLSVKALSNASKSVIRTASREITFSEDGKSYTLPLPKPIRIMFEMINQLKDNDFEIYVISATNYFSAALLCEHYFGLNNANVFGMKNITRLSGGEIILTDEIEEPMPLGPDKIEVYRQLISQKRPMITAGDSINDLELLNYTHDSGLCFIVGKDDEKQSSLHDKVSAANKFCLGY